MRSEGLKTTLGFPTRFLSLFSISILASWASSRETLTLDEALRTALEANREYRIARLDERAAANDATWGKAGLLPKVDATAAWNRSLLDSRQERVQGAGLAVEERDGAESRSATAGVGATWTVFEGFASLAALSRLETRAKLASLRSEAARQGLAAEVILAYGAAVRERRVLIALDSAMAFSRERVRLTEGKYRLGSASKLELLQAKLDLNADSSARLRQELALLASKRALNRILARPEAAPFDVSDSLPLAPLPALEELKARALERNPVWLQAAEGERLARLGFREYAGHLFPKLGLTAGYNYGLTSSEAGFLRENEQSGWTYGANLRFNLFDGGAVRSDFRNARVAISRAALGAEEAKAEVEAALSGAWDGWQAALRLLELEAANLELARENAAIALERLRLGTIASLELRAAQEASFDAETRLVSARFEAKRSETELLRLAARLAP